MAKRKLSRGLFGKRGKRLLVIPRVAAAIAAKKAPVKRTRQFLGATLIKNAKRVKGGPRKIRKDKSSMIWQTSSHHSAYHTI